MSFSPVGHLSRLHIAAAAIVVIIIIINSYHLLRALLHFRHWRGALYTWSSQHLLGINIHIFKMRKLSL